MIFNLNILWRIMLTCTVASFFYLFCYCRFIVIFCFFFCFSYEKLKKNACWEPTALTCLSSSHIFNHFMNWNIVVHILKKMVYCTICLSFCFINKVRYFKLFVWGLISNLQKAVFNSFRRINNMWNIRNKFKLNWSELKSVTVINCRVYFVKVLRNSDVQQWVPQSILTQNTWSSHTWKSNVW